MKQQEALFISYAHIDNQPVQSADQGWVTAFHQALTTRLANFLGEQVPVWRDKKLQGNDVFGDEILDQLRQATIFVPIITPRYVKSAWCTKELDFFTGQRMTRRDNQSPVFKVVKTPVPIKEQATVLQGLTGYEFYLFHHETELFTELSTYGDEQARLQFWKNIDMLAQHIVRFIKKGQSAQPTPAGTSQTLYVAETSHELNQERMELIRNLESQGYRILPENRLPLVASQAQEAIASALDEAALSIHLIGSGYGFVPEESQDSIVVMQNQLAAAHSKKKPFPRFIWKPDYVEVQDERQHAFLNELTHNEAAMTGAEFFEGPIDEMLYSLEKALADQRSDKPRLFLAETSSDLAPLHQQVKTTLQQQGYTVLPETRLALNKNELHQQLSKQLPTALYSIHLLGRIYGVIPELAQQSLPDLQVQVAGQYPDKVIAVYWLSPDDASEPAATDLREQVRRQMAARPHAHLLECAPEELPERLIQQLAEWEVARQDAQALQVPAQQPPAVYLIFDSSDFEAITPLYDFLFESGMEVLLPLFDGSEASIREEHERHLTQARAVIIFYGHAPDAWFQAKLRDMQRLPVLPREEPLVAQAAYLAEPFSPRKKLLRLHDWMVIKDTGEFSPELLTDFIEQVRKK